MGEEFPGQPTEEPQHRQIPVQEGLAEDAQEQQQPEQPTEQILEAPAEEPAAEAAQDAPTEEFTHDPAEDEGRWDEDKAHTIGAAINESGGDNYTSEEDRELMSSGAAQATREELALDEALAGIAKTKNVDANRTRAQIEALKDENSYHAVAYRNRLANEQHYVENPQETSQGIEHVKGYEDRMNELTERVETVREARMDRIGRQERDYEAVYDLDPEKFKDMPTAQFVEIMREYSEVADKLEVAQATLEAHNGIIETINKAIKEHDPSILTPHKRYGGIHDEPYFHQGEVIYGHFATEDNIMYQDVYHHGNMVPIATYDKVGLPAYGPSAQSFRKNNFSLGGLIFEERHSSEKEIEATVEQYEADGEDDKARVVQQIHKLENVFGLSPEARLEGYRTLVAEYWAPKAAAARDAAEAKLEEFRNKYRPAPEPTEQAA